MKIEKKKLIEFLQVVGKHANVKGGIFSCIKCTTNKTSILFTFNKLTFQMTTTIDFEEQENVPDTKVYVLEYTRLNRAVRSIKGKILDFQFDSEVLVNGLTLPDFTDKALDYPEDIILGDVLASAHIDKWEKIEYLTNCTSTDETRIFLSGVCFEFEEGILQAVSTDGRICCYTNDFEFGTYDKCDLPENESVIMPYLQHLLKISFDSFEVHNNYGVFRNSTHEVIITRIAGQFPNYKRIIPNSDRLADLKLNSENFETLMKMVKTECKLGGYTKTNIRDHKIAVKITNNNFFLVEATDNDTLIKATDHKGIDAEHFKELTLKVSVFYLNKLSVSNDTVWEIFDHDSYEGNDYYRYYDKVIKYSDNVNGLGFVVMPMRDN